MSRPHVIRLRGPWRTDDGHRLSLPSIWQAALGDSRQVTLSRSFNWVRDLTEIQSVTLRVASPQHVERILVNGNEMRDGSELGIVLAVANQLSITLALKAPEANLLDASLEIIEQD